MRTLIMWAICFGGFYLGSEISERQDLSYFIGVATLSLAILVSKYKLVKIDSKKNQINNQ